MDKCEFFKFVGHGDVEAWKDVGWVCERSLEGTHHGQYSVLMKWPREGQPQIPAAQSEP